MSSYELQASVYDAIYTHRKDYLREAKVLHQLLHRYLRSAGHSLLDVACGTGLHDQYLVKWYSVEGLDLSPAQLAIARGRLPGLKFYQADMTDFDTGKRYDVVTCLFSAIGHMTTVPQLHRAVANMARHLVPGGVLAVEPWLFPGDFTPGHIGVDVVEADGLDIQRMSYSTLHHGNISRLEMHHTVGRRGEGVEHFVEVIDAALYTPDQYLAAMRAAGLEETWHDAEGLMGRGLFIGRLPDPR